MRARALLVALALALPGLPARAEDAPKPPDLDEILKKVDAGLFFTDAQPGLLSYECDVASTTSAFLDSSGAWQPDPKSAKPVAHVAVDAKAGTTTWTDAAKKKVLPGTFTPFCGPWTLTNVMRVEVELFATPLSKRFASDRFERLVEADGDGWRLYFEPKDALDEGEPEPLRPTVTRIDLAVTSAYAVTGGTLRTDQKVSQDEATFECGFEPKGTLRRVAWIKTRLTSFNLAVAPTITFAYAPQSGLDLPKAVRFEVPGGDLSPSLRGMPGGGGMVSALLYDKFAVKVEPPTPTKPATAPKPPKPPKPAR